LSAAETSPRPLNRLAEETSPYLRLHAHNPVDWYPWGPEALARAARENKPIFLSIGYSTCFWCHVMERQSFMDDTIAAYMNEHFINIKVDREERPDLDDLYMLALQVYFQAAGSPQGGGWPMSLFLTPQGKPIVGGTYFPPRDQPGMTGFETVLHRVHELWTTRENDLRQSADLLAGEVQRLSLPVRDAAVVPLSSALVTAAERGVIGQFDPEHGGLDFDAAQPVGPKFPVPCRLLLLQRPRSAGAPSVPQTSTDVANSPSLADILELTLERMARGGIHDHLAGGFHRYSTDREWHVPHFEKMLYDNVQLAEVYALAGRRDVAEGIFEFLLSRMVDPRGGFYAALDAETDGIEGKHYVWTRDEVVDVLGAADARAFLVTYGFERPQSFEQGHVLHLPAPLSTVAAAEGLTRDELQSRVDAARSKLLTRRNTRPPLLRDDKILTSWNGLAIRALARSGVQLDRPDLLEAARTTARFLLTVMRDDQGHLLHTERGNLPPIPGYLDDYALLAEGLLALHEATGEAEWLTAARQLTDEQLELFWDDAGHGFFFTSALHEELLARTKNAYDSVTPSGNSASVRNLIRLAQRTGHAEYRLRAEQTLSAFAAQLQQTPASLPYLALALDEFLATASPASDVAPAGTPQVTLRPVAELAQNSQAASSSASAPPSGSEPLVVAGRTDPRQQDATVAAKAYLSLDKLTPGGPVDVVVAVTIRDGWHINTNPAEPDFLVATELSARTTLKTSLTVAPYPKGKSFRIEGFDEPASVYEKEVLLRGTLTAPEGAAGQTETVELNLHYQACNERNCLRPTDATLTFRVPVAAVGERPGAINQRLFPKDPPR
jgi:hypothetical protein